MKFRSRLLLRAISILGTLVLLWLALQVNASTALAQPSKSSKKKRSAAAQSQSVPACQPPDSMTTQSAQAGSMSHTIVLSWNASIPSPSHPNKALGYCLYRSLIEGDAKLEAKCNKCELLTPQPVMGTSCVDNAVTAGPTYYYVVAGVNGGGMSGPSNETSASFQTENPTGSPPVGIPSCGGQKLVRK